MTLTAVTLVLIVHSLVASALPSQVRANKDYDFCFVNGHVYEHEDVFSLPRDPCTKYKCYGGRPDIIQVDCKDSNGRCHAMGSTWADGCGNFTCQRHGSNGWRTTYQAGCSGGHNECHPVNTRFTTGCSTFQCSALSNGGSKSTLLTAMCKDAYGKCHNPGSLFSYVINGRQYRRCVCRQHADTIRYQCH